MKQAYKKRPPRATANSPPVLPDMGEIYFINLVNVIIQVINHLHVNAIAFYSTCKGNKTGTKSII